MMDMEKFKKNLKMKIEECIDECFEEYMMDDDGYEEESEDYEEEMEGSSDKNKKLKEAIVIGFGKK